ncbi:MAG: hypothetical protein JW730_20705 [Anaerolineales bacterium]|nr:hypothetical protein [Anaerolineales bacterium]
MTTAQVTKLRPLGMGELLDHAFRLYRRNFFTFIGIIAVVQVPLTLLTMLTTLLTASEMITNTYSYTGPAPESVLDTLGPGFGLGMLGTLFLGIIGFVLLQGLATAALTRAVAGDYLGERLGFIDAYRKVGNSWGKVILALLLGSLINIALALFWIIIPCVGWFTGAGMLYFFSGIVMQIVPAIIVLEKKTPKDAIRRGWDLTRRRFWWVVGFAALLYVFNQVIVAGPVTLINWVLQYATSSLAADPAMMVIVTNVTQSLLTLVMTLLYLPLQLAALTLLYFDLRVRTEGFDLAWTAERALDADAALEDIVAQAPAPETNKLVGKNELGNFFLLTIAFVGVIMAISMVLGLLGVLATGLIGGF